METLTARFLRSANLCRTRDLELLGALAELMKVLGELIHVLQKERGSSAIFLGSNGVQFADQLAVRVAECRKLEQTARERLEQVDRKLDQVMSAARLYTRMAIAFRALDTLVGVREQVASLAIAPQDAVKSFTDMIGHLLAVNYEIADIPADPEVSRLLIALVNFAQGKEYAGQERAITGAALSNGHFSPRDQRRLRHLVPAQEESFRIALEFADPRHIAGLREVLTGPESTQLKRLRRMLGGRRQGDPISVDADAWYQQATRRIDAMKAIEDQMACDLAGLCAAKLLDVEEHPENAEIDGALELAAAAPMAMLVSGAIGLYVLPEAQPKPMRSILGVIQAQSRHIHEVSSQLESARVALTERKVIERAKGLLMESRRLPEKDAYGLMRETAMSQNKRIVEIAEAIVSMAEMSKK